jgi:hypothetical protein
MAAARQGLHGGVTLALKNSPHCLMPPSQWGHIPTSLHFLGVSCPRCPRSISACPRFPWGQTIRASIGFAGDFEFAPAAPVFKTPTPKFKALAIRLAGHAPAMKVLPRPCPSRVNSATLASYMPANAKGVIPLPPLRYFLNTSHCGVLQPRVRASASSFGLLDKLVDAVKTAHCNSPHPCRLLTERPVGASKVQCFQALPPLVNLRVCKREIAGGGGIKTMCPQF